MSTIIRVWFDCQVNGFKNIIRLLYKLKYYINAVILPRESNTDMDKKWITLMEAKFYKFLLIVHFWLPLRYSAAFVQKGFYEFHYWNE